MENEKWTISGSPDQQAIVRGALVKIKFPFNLLSFAGTPELGWRDLNARASGGKPHMPHPPGYHDNPEADEPHFIEGLLSGRKYTLGVFYTGSATIYIDNALVSYPEVAEATVAAEIAHAVDYFLPLTDLQRDTFIRLLNDGQPNENTWWEISDYSTEYFTLAGEAFMFLFCRAYSDIPFGSVAAFEDKGENITPAQIRAVIGIERTDFIPPAPKPEKEFVRFGAGKVYHIPSHYENRVGKPVTKLAFPSLRPCKICIK